MVENLAVEDGHDVAVGAEGRLRAMLDVDDRQASGPQDDLVLEMKVAGVRPAIANLLEHRQAERFAVQRPRLQATDDSTHGRLTSVPGPRSRASRCQVGSACR